MGSLGILAVLQGGLAEGAVLIGIDDARDRIVEIDTSSGAIETLVASNDVRADRIVWSPDESFAYLVDRKRNRLLVYDPSLRAVSHVIPVTGALGLLFSPDGDRAYVAGCDTEIVDTRTRKVVDVLPALGPRSWQDELFPWGEKVETPTFNTARSRRTLQAVAVLIGHSSGNRECKWVDAAVRLAHLSSGGFERLPRLPRRRYQLPR